MKCDDVIGLGIYKQLVVGQMKNVTY